MMIKSPKLAIGVLTWRSPKTLQSSLESYERLGLASIADEKFVFVQECNLEELKISESFGWHSLVSSENVGIGSAYKALLNAVCSEFFIFLECDWRMFSHEDGQIQASIDLIESGRADLVRLRSVTRPGFPLGALRIQNREYLQPSWLLESIYYEPNPWDRHPGQIGRAESGGFNYAVSSAQWAGWSNNPHIARTAFLKELLHHQGLDNLENDLSGAWTQRNPIVGHGPGLFTHKRIDGLAINKRSCAYAFDQRMRWWTKALRRKMAPLVDKIQSRQSMG